MQKRTIAIIAIAKGNTKYCKGSKIENIISYLSEASRVEPDFYDAVETGKQLKKAFYDFLDTCDKPSYYLNEIDRLMGFPNDYSRNQAIIAVLTTVQVKDGNKWLNGFSEEFNHIIDELS